MILTRRAVVTAGAALTGALLTRKAWAIQPDAMALGSPDAPIRLTEYASATCPYCAHFHEINWMDLKTNYVDRGLVHFTMREMLTPPPAVALGMFQTARSGDADAPEYFRRLAILFERQRAILGTGTMAGVRDALVALGSEWGLAADQVMSSLTDQTAVERIERSIAEAHQRGVTGTPAFFIDNERIEGQLFQTPDGMRTVLDARLASAG